MNNTILSDIKKMLGLTNEYTAFDNDILIHINSAVSILSQMGVGPDNGYIVESESTWDDYLGEDYLQDISQVKSYIYLRVKKLFDPPQSSVVMNSVDSQIKEFEVRMYTQKGGY